MITVPNSAYRDDQPTNQETADSGTVLCVD